MNLSEIDLTNQFFHIFNVTNLHKLVGPHNNRKGINNLVFTGWVALMLFIFTPTLAQERTGFGQDESYRAQDEFSATDSRVSNGPASIAKEKEAVRDTASGKPPAAIVNSKVEPGAPKKQEDETLSYNLLYFIIQKFKVSEMVD
jgi:hypothetical protein